MAVAFGLKSTPAWASLVSGELCRILQSFGIKVAGVYIDDILLRALTKAQGVKDRILAEQIASALGVPFNHKTKGPLQKIPYLGVEIDTVTGLMSVTDEYRQYAISRVEEALKRSTIARKGLESLCGILTWISFIFDSGRPRRNLMYRALSTAKAQVRVNREH